MIALKPVLQSWLEQAEADARIKRKNEETMSTSSNATNLSSMSNSASSYMGNHSMSAAERKRKRTSIAAPEKRSLEAYFAIQPRPSGEKIAQIAEKLDLKKNVVRVWFCNQRQKQKRMKFAGTQGKFWF
jgi:class 4 POU domain transcription factor